MNGEVNGGITTNNGAKLCILWEFGKIHPFLRRDETQKWAL